MLESPQKKRASLKSKQTKQQDMCNFLCMFHLTPLDQSSVSRENCVWVKTDETKRKQRSCICCTHCTIHGNTRCIAISKTADKDTFYWSLFLFIHKQLFKVQSNRGWLHPLVHMPGHLLGGLLQVGDQVGPVLLLLESGEDHLGAGDELLWLGQVLVQSLGAPGDALVDVGLHGKVIVLLMTRRMATMISPGCRSSRLLDQWSCRRARAGWVLSAISSEYLFIKRKMRSYQLCGALPPPQYGTGCRPWWRSSCPCLPTFWWFRCTSSLLEGLVLNEPQFYFGFNSNFFVIFA